MKALRPFARFLARDVGLALLLAGAWQLDTLLRRSSEGGSLAVVVAILAGLLSAVVGFLCHEWGHLLGTAFSGGVAHAPTRLSSVFLFHFDVERSDRRAFLSMSYGGYAASALALSVILLAVPWATLSGQVALGATALGVLVTFVLEIPTTVRVARGAPLPAGGVFVGTPPPRT